MNAASELCANQLRTSRVMWILINTLDSFDDLKVRDFNFSSPASRINSSCSPAASSRLRPRSGSSRRLAPAGGAGRARRRSGCVWASWRRDRGAAGCPGTRRYLGRETRKEGWKVKAELEQLVPTGPVRCVCVCVCVCVCGLPHQKQCEQR